MNKYKSIMEALFADDIDAVKEFLKNGADVNKPYNHHNWTPFLWACKEFYEPELIQLFLDNGADINWRNDEGSTPLHIMARRRSSFACLELLIENGANPNAQDNDGWTPIMDALHHPQASMRYKLIVELLFESDLSIKNNKGKTALDIAIENKAIACDEMLLELLEA